MARPSNPEISRRLRDGAVDYVLSHGVADLALRPLAKALKTNARMLIYHFGSREGLMKEILAGLRQREDAVIRTWFRRGGKPTLSEFLRWYWKRLSAPQARPAAHLIFELYALALRDPQRYPGVLTDPVKYWRNLAELSGVSPEVGTAEATLLLAMIQQRFCLRVEPGQKVEAVPTVTLRPKNGIPVRVARRASLRTVTRERE